MSSIAVSVVVKPSRILLTMVAGMSIGILLIGIIMGMGKVGDWPLTVRLPIFIIYTLIAIFGFYCTGQIGKTHHIDISGIGQIRLGEYSPLAALSLNSVASRRLRRYGAGEVVSLMADSTLWPFLLLLRLKKENRRITVLPILPDSIEGDRFRVLSVACRWIAAHNNSAG